MPFRPYNLGAWTRKTFALTKNLKGVKSWVFWVDRVDRVYRVYRVFRVFRVYRGFIEGLYRVYIGFF